MSEEVYEYSATYGEQSGGCQKLAEVGSHEVFNTHTDKEPWLNLRTSPGTEGKVIGKLSDGSELQILADNGSWRNVKVVSGFEAGRTGWAHSKWIRKLEAGQSIGTSP